MTLLEVLVLGLFFAMGCLMLIALRILIAQRNRLSTDNHWHPDHSLCDDCPTLRKRLIKGWTVFVKGWTVLGYAMAVLGGAFALWYSPTLFYDGRKWVEMYSVCVESSTDSKTLGDFYSTRVSCTRWASRTLHKSR